MKRLLIIGFALFISSLFMFYSTKQPDSEIIYQNWIMIAESDSMIEVSVQVLSCNQQSSPQVFIEIFNENSDNELAHFNLKLTRPQTNEEEIHEISLAVSKGAIVKPGCGNSDYPSLRLNVPAGWDPTTVGFSLTFIP